VVQARQIARHHRVETVRAQPFGEHLRLGGGVERRVGALQFSRTVRSVSLRLSMP
jgi:hypothetical protein